MSTMNLFLFDDYQRDLFVFILFICFGHLGFRIVVGGFLLAFQVIGSLFGLYVLG